ncbi:MAG TPA: 5-oxoprolinase subunit PxpB [Gemmatimonadales bacterium]
MIAPLGDTALVIRVGTQIDEPTRRRVRAIARVLEDARIPGAADVVPGFTTVTVHYDPARVHAPDDPALAPYDLMHRHISSVLESVVDDALIDGASVEIPICYGGEFGPDLEHVASYTGLSEAGVIDLHSTAEYRVHLLGFLPGFPYLGGMDPRLATPRRGTPRTTVPAGSVGIGGAQTGVYPLESPGGWQLIGRSPVILFDPLRSPPTLLAAGDLVRFRAIDRREYDLLFRSRM